MSAAAWVDPQALLRLQAQLEVAHAAHCPYCIDDRVAELQAEAQRRIAAAARVRADRAPHART